MKPQHAWQKLHAGNERFINGTSEHPNQDAAHRESLVSAQTPFAVIFGCSDSRLAAEIIFDLGLGDAFVVRTAGQVIDSAVLGSIEYSVAELQVPLIVVLGHDNCGAVTATAEAVDSTEMPSGYMRDLVERITPSVLASRRHGGTTVNDYVTEHVQQTAHRLVGTSRVVAEAVAQGETAVVGVSYQLLDGHARLVGHVGEL